ncbi:hypothetical protein M422DRAFT_38929 [Sphaerobolus stellatus SS14]|uniref:EamA domain-containing protein n=1 Tax=Sphaerobolus stellatus (strain SS14) TaxID=990650 RepID=A0A0C9UIM3_SPHS4|nr:hypothetical protein M422DRAFT_38929 [Sphaerobolus stellatus SS14]
MNISARPIVLPPTPATAIFNGVSTSYTWGERLKRLRSFVIELYLNNDMRKIPHPILGPPGIRYLLVFRGVSGISLSDAIVLTFLSPTTTAIAGCLLLHEKISRREVLAGLLSLLGVILIARPQSLFGKHNGGNTSSDETSDIPLEATATQRLAVGMAMLGVMGATGAYVTLRAIGIRAHTMHSLTFFSSYSAIVSTIGMFALRIKPVIPTQWAWCELLFAISIYGFLVLLVLGLQRETASRGALSFYVQVIFAPVFERIVFKTLPSYLSILGTVIIMGSAIYIAVGTQHADDLEVQEFTEEESFTNLQEVLESSTEPGSTPIKKLGPMPVPVAPGRF